MELCISIKEKIATADHEAVVVCDNTDYTIRFQFDAPWAAHSLKTARFLWLQAGNETYVDVPFSGECVSMPAIHDAAWVQVGVYAGDLETTTPAMLMCVPSIRQGAPAPDLPEKSVYDQIIGMINAGTLQGPPGEDGQTVRIWAVPDRTSSDCIYDFIGFERLAGGVAPTEETVNPGDVLICKDGGLLYIRQIMYIGTRPVIISTTGTDQAEPPIILAGKQGVPGATPVLSIGTVDTLEAGAKATASITGTAENPVLNLGIPKGAGGADTELFAPMTHSHSEYAAAGYGYGEEMSWLGFDPASWSSTDTFQADLESVFAAMPQGTCKQVQFIDANLSTQKFTGTLWKYTSAYGFLTADNYSGAKAHRGYYSNAWGEWEWENPPMAAGTEYRTSERSNGKAVYVKRVDIGSLPATGSKNATYSGYAATLVRIEGRAWKTDGTWKSLPFYTSNGDLRAFIDGTKYKVYVTTFSDLSAYSCTVDCYYTKD